ncbi:LANO_0A04984g1_1 [Lachancea nothofagi CBS 11611]|uniref:LANO_0A04984g1_1 n=1 Tax=Lachancea nothofagi CBS 11611 TaxID=1266666 RepID=A0A1G4IR40_9SACH|nr:LANO_0A04984g1_1 [Lachancea nothofagi CBS 11611]
MSNDKNSHQTHDETAEKELTTSEIEDAPREPSVTEVNAVEIDKLECTPGPLTPQVLIQWLPGELNFTSFDAYDKNLYLGTDQGDLLHYFEMEANNYMLVSQTEFDSDQKASIESIKVMPLIEIALVQSGETLHFFLLPEFAPVPNMDSVPYVSDFQILRYSSSSKSYQIQTFGAEGIRYLNVTGKRVSISDVVSTKPISKAHTYHKTMMASNGSNYEIVDLKSGREIPLFRVSEMSADLKPLIVSYSPGEFLLACGSSGSENAMGLVVNCKGDITQGTIVFEKFPLDILIDLPFIIVDYGDSGAFVYRVEPNDEPRVVQKLWSTNKSRLRMVKTSHAFAVNNPSRKSQIVDKLRLVPLIAGNNEFRIEQEQTYVASNYEEVTSLVLYSAVGIHLLYKESIILQIADYSESTMNKIESILGNNLSSSYISAFNKMEAHFLRLLLLLLETLHSSSIDQRIVSNWCIYSPTVDIRIFLYLCSVKIFGDPWVPNGLTNFICETRSLKLKNKFTDFLSIMKFLRHKLHDNELRGLKDKENIFRSIDLAVVESCIHNGLDVDITECESSSYSDLLPELQKNKERYGSIIFDLYHHNGDYANCLTLLREQKRGSEMSKFILINLEHLLRCDAYKEHGLLADVVFLVNLEIHGDERLNVLRNIKKILERAGLGIKDMVAMAENSTAKIAILESLGSEDFNDKQFMIDYYVAKLEDIMEKEKLWDFFAELSTSYSQDLDYMKPSFKTFLDLRIKASQKCASLIEIGEKVRTLMYEGNDRAMFDAVTDRIKNFDTASILLLFLIEDEDKHEILGHNLLDKLMAFNDFDSIDKVVGKENVVRVLLYYINLGSKRDSQLLMRTHLAKHLRILDSHESLLEALKLIPLDYGLGSIVDALSPVLINFENTLATQELHKALLRQQLQAIQDSLQKLEQS